MNLIPRVPRGFFTGPRYVRRMLRPFATMALLLAVLTLALGQAVMGTAALLGAPRAAMLSAKGGLGVYNGSQAKSTTNGAVDNFTTDGSGRALPDLTLMPSGSWAVILSSSGSNAASGTWLATVMATIGYAANGGGTISEYSVCASAQDNVAASNTGRRMAAKAFTQVNPDGSTLVGEANLTMRAGGGFTLTWGTQTGANASQINFTLVTGLTGAKVVSWTTLATGNPIPVTGVGFLPDLVFHATAVTTGVGSSTEAYLGVGMMNKAGQQGANAIYAGDAINPSNTSRYQRTDSCLVQVAANETSRASLAFQAMGADGFTTYARTASASDAVVSLCMKGVSSKIGAFTKPTAAATVAQTVASRQGFRPKGLLFGNTRNLPNASPIARAAWGLSSTDLTNERAVALFDNDAVTPTDANSVWYNDKAIVIGEDNTAATNSAADQTAVALDSFTLSWTTNDANAMEVLYCVLGNAGTDTWPTVRLDTATTNAAATGTSNQKKVAVLSSGREVRVVGETTTNARFEWSDDGFQTVTDYANDVGGWANGSIYVYTDTPGGVQRLIVTWKQSGVSGTGPSGGARTSGEMYVAVGTLNAGATTITWGAAVSLASGGGATRDYPDVVAVAEGAGGKAFTAWSYSDAASHITYFQSQTITSGGVLTLDGGFTATTDAGGGTLPASFPSLAINPVTKRVHAAWSNGKTGAGFGIRYRTASYSVGTWTWAASEVDVGTGHYLFDAAYGVVCRWDEGRSAVVIAGQAFTGAAAKVAWWDSTNFTSFTNRIDQTVSTGAYLFGPGVAIDPATGDGYLIGSNSGYGDVQYYKATRAGAALTLGTKVVTDAFTGAAAGPPYVNAFVRANGDMAWIYTRGASSPSGIAYDRIDV